MSEENDDPILAHDVYVSANKIDFNELPDGLIAKYDAVEKMCDAYDEDPSEDKSTDAIVKASADLKTDIQAWHEAKVAEPAPVPVPTQKTAEPTPTPTPTPAATGATEE